MNEKKPIKNIKFIISIVLFLILTISGAGFFAINNMNKPQGSKAQNTISQEASKSKIEKDGKTENNSNTSSSSNSNLISSNSNQVSSSSSNSSSQSSVNANLNFAQTVANGAAANSGLNWRSQPCGEILGSVKRWGNVGSVIKGPVQTLCGGSNSDFYFIKWEDGTSGWSAADNLSFSEKKPELAIGTISGQVFYGSEYLPPFRVCAVDISSKTEFCNEYPKGAPAQDRNGKYIDQTPLTKFNLEVPVGNYWIYSQFPGIADIGNGTNKAYFTSCSFNNTAVSPEKLAQICGYPSIQAVPVVKISVAGGENVTDINLADTYTRKITF